MLLIELSLSLNHLKTRDVGGFKEGKRERAHRASAIRLAAETELYRGPSKLEALESRLLRC